MDLSITIETLTSVTSQGLGFTKLLRKSSNYISVSDSTDQSTATFAFQISAGILPLDVLAPPPVQSNCVKTRPRTLLRRKRKTKRRSFSGDDGDDAADDGGFLGEDDSFTGGLGFYGGGSGGGGSGGGSGGNERWNFGGNNWDDSSSWWSGSGSNFAFDFIYEVIYWIAFSNCMHFAFKKVVRTAADGRVKVPVRLATVY